MKNKLIQLAKEAGFKSEIISDEIWKYSNNEELRWLFWMTALQKWLREKHEIIVESTPQRSFSHLCYCWQIYGMDKNSYKPDTYEIIYFTSQSFETYEKALEVVLLKGLTLIK